MKNCLIITKNIICILLFQSPEWSEDFRDWSREVHIKCTYQGIPVSHIFLTMSSEMTPLRRLLLTNKWRCSSHSWSCC